MISRTALLFFIALLIPSVGFAQDNTNSTGTISASGSNATINTNSQGSDMSKMVPNVIIPALGNTPETCAISNAAGGSFSGFGLVFGVTITEEQCNRRMNARLVAQLGDPKAAKAILCQDANIRAAYKVVGNPCVIDTQPEEKQPASTRPDMFQPYEPQGSG